MCLFSRFVVESNQVSDIIVLLHCILLIISLNTRGLVISGLLRLTLPFLYKVYRFTAPTELKHLTDTCEILHWDLPFLGLLRLDIAACSNDCLEVGAMRCRYHLVLLSIVILKFQESQSLLFEKIDIESVGLCSRRSEFIVEDLHKLLGACREVMSA